MDKKSPGFKILAAILGRGESERHISESGRHVSQWLDKNPF